jgi:hypothetical protein
MIRMAVYCDQTELPHAPRLIANRLADFSLGSENRRIERVDLVDLQVCEVGMVTELAWWNCIWALRGHDFAIARRVKKPTGVWDRVDGESEHISVESSRTLQIGNCYDVEIVGTVRILVAQSEDSIFRFWWPWNNCCNITIRLIDPARSVSSGTTNVS